MASSDRVLRAQAKAIVELSEQAAVQADVLRKVFEYAQDLERRLSDSESSKQSTRLRAIMDSLWVKQRMRIPVGTDRFDFQGGGSGSWETDTIPFTPSTVLLPSTIVGEEIYFIDQSTNFYLYNYRTKTWTQKANPDTDSNRVRGGIIRRGKVYFAGGTVIHIYDIGDDSWSTTSAVGGGSGIDVLHAMCFENDDTIWCYARNNAPKDVAAKYVISTDTWTVGAADSAGHKISFCLLFNNGKLYAGTNNGVRIYDTSAETFASANIASGRDFMVGHNPVALIYYETTGYGYWMKADESLNDDVIESTTVLAGHTLYGIMSTDYKDMLVVGSVITELAIFKSLPKTAQIWIEGDNFHWIDSSGVEQITIAQSLFDANTILAADSDDTPAALTVAEERLVGRITSGNIDDLTPAQVLKMLGAQHPLANTYVSGTGTAGSDNTAQDVKTVVIP
ncbi:hypothetical protein LCGC14_2578390, partial [marine sediment metagenome]